MIGKRIEWIGQGFTLITKNNDTIYRNRGDHKVTGVVVSVETNKFYQTTEGVTWLTVKLDRTWGRYQYAKAYWHATDNGGIGRPLDLKWEQWRFVQ